ncbi:Transcriptional regulatory protein ZraR [uncultured Desulfatiglans sp.]|uniref:Transcriptional regulatory protein ZraR n=1 Tax=Uncultured Desulfatiglans sp. TaxID=1748965 RepID=A0A653A366_UNCDX|nr:Transcriptional regulatory protein ZraR [uncultured Desulfatiglans sp.]
MDHFQILFVDDEPDIREIAHKYMTFHGYKIRVAESGDVALERLRMERFPVVFTDLFMPGMDGLTLLKIIKDEWPATDVVVLTGYGSIKSAIEATKLGCYDYLQKPMKLERLKLLVDQIAERWKKTEPDNLLEVDGDYGSFDGVVGKSPRMQEIFALISKISSNGPTVLIHGESGTGKELIARVIWRKSSRQDKPFVPVNCGAIPEGLAESELFGHVNGAFTGTVRDTKGLFEAADGGTLFLDEITEISSCMQVKLLRALQEKCIRRVGESKELSVDVRVIAATNRDPLVSLQEGRLREDLYYRLNVVPIMLPPLRERKEDVEGLARHFLKRLERMNKKNGPISITTQALDALRRYHWPGNVRELENVIERAFLLCSDHLIRLCDLPSNIVAMPQNSSSQNLKLRTHEANLIEKALSEAGSNKSTAADLLGINLSTLYRKMKKYDIPL